MLSISSPICLQNRQLLLDQIESTRFHNQLAPDHPIN
jgi:hypothetical protein